MVIFNYLATFDDILGHFSVSYGLVSHSVVRQLPLSG